MHCCVKSLVGYHTCTQYPPETPYLTQIENGGACSSCCIVTFRLRCFSRSNSCQTHGAVARERWCAGWYSETNKNLQKCRDRSRRRSRRSKGLFLDNPKRYQQVPEWPGGLYSRRAFSCGNTHSRRQQNPQRNSSWSRNGSNDVIRP